MNGLIVFVLLALAVVIAGLVREIVLFRRDMVSDLKILKSDLGNMAGKQIGLESEYHEVHKILQSIRDLNAAELQDRKEILQHQNLSTSNRVLQTRAHLAELEAAARRELEGLNG